MAVVELSYRRNWEAGDRFVRGFARDERIFAEGEVGKEMYVVLSGSVLIRRRREGGESAVATLVTGDIFGEMALVESQPRFATAVAGEDGTRVMVIDQARFVYLVSQQPAFALTVMQVLSRRIREQQPV